MGTVKGTVETAWTQLGNLGEWMNLQAQGTVGGVAPLIVTAL